LGGCPRQLSDRIAAAGGNRGDEIDDLFAFYR
jgi:hypothetical protein